jgi:hypothetical protein
VILVLVPSAAYMGTTLYSIGVSTSSRTVHCGPYAGPTFQTCRRVSVVV